MEDYIQQKYINIPIEFMQLDDNLRNPISSITQKFSPISLQEMDAVKLMNRVDTKFLINIRQLHVLLKKAIEHYRIVEIEGERAPHYSSIYFDTEDTEMYRMHHNGKLNRYKIRMRSYVDSGISFLEVKNKNNKGRTSKKRIKIDEDCFQHIRLNESGQDFLHSKTPYQSRDLKPQIQNFFERITLVDKNKTERVTIDFGLIYKDIDTGITKNVDDLVIVEMKQDGASKSYFRQYLNELKVLPGSMSKYCLGMVLLNSNIKNNSFKKKIRKINKITEKKSCYKLTSPNLIPQLLRNMERKDFPELTF